MLESYVQSRLKERDILIMTHIVIGYPSLEESFRLIEVMVEAGVDLMELQIPFSEMFRLGQEGCAEICHPVFVYELLLYSFQLWCESLQ